MLAEVRLVIAPKEARLLVRHGDDVIEDEVWRLERPMGRAEAKELAKVAFDDSFDLMQYAVHGE
jgi:hypothetical protein